MTCWATRIRRRRIIHTRRAPTATPIEQDPDDPGHRHGLADALVAESKYAEAVEQFKKLTSSSLARLIIYLRLAELYRQLGQFDDAQTESHAGKTARTGQP